MLVRGLRAAAIPAALLAFPAAGCESGGDCAFDPAAEGTTCSADAPCPCGYRCGSAGTCAVVKPPLKVYTVESGEAALDELARRFEESNPAAASPDAEAMCDAREALGCFEDEEDEVPEDEVEKCLKAWVLLQDIAGELGCLSQFQAVLGCVKAHPAPTCDGPHLEPAEGSCLEEGEELSVCSASARGLGECRPDRYRFQGLSDAETCTVGIETTCGTVSEASCALPGPDSPSPPTGWHCECTKDSGKPAFAFAVQGSDSCFDAIGAVEEACGTTPGSFDDPEPAAEEP